MTAIVKSKDAAKAAAALRNGGLIIYPTETQYAIGADATSRQALEKVFAVKRRPEEKKLIIAFSSLAMAGKYLKLGKEATVLARHFMPGPLTLVVKSTKGLAMKGDAAFRIPDNAAALAVIRRFGKPVTTTSANISGDRPIYRIKDIINTFSGKVDVVMDAGDLPRRGPSTVFDMQSRKILRKGPVSLKDIRKVLERI